jgi:hypothetical protein
LSDKRDEPEVLLVPRGDDAPGEVQKAPPEPPVVARLVVDIRSDGTRTIARGAMEDVASGQSEANEAKGTTPMSLALELAKSMLKVRSLAGTVARALLPGRRK